MTSSPWTLIHPPSTKISFHHLVVVLPSPLHRPTSSLSPRDHGQMHHCTRCSRIYAPACQCTFVKQLPPTSGGATKELACLRKPTTNNYLTGEACEVPQLGASTEKRGFGDSITSHEWLGYIISIHEISRGPKKNSAVHQNCDEPPSQPKTPPPHLKGKAMPGWNPGQSHLQQSHPPGLSRHFFAG